MQSEDRTVRRPAQELRSKANGPPLDQPLADPAAAWFEFDPTPLFVLGADGAILGTNGAARRLLREGTTVRARGPLLIFAQLEARRSFAEGLAKITSGAASDFRLLLRCDNGQWRRFELLSCDGPPAAAYLAVRGEPRPELDIGPVRQAFRLSSAEGKVLFHITQGLAPKAIAARLEVSPHTVRAHLRSLYVKMNVSGITDLVRECTRLTA